MQLYGLEGGSTRQIVPLSTRSPSCDYIAQARATPSLTLPRFLNRVPKQLLPHRSKVGHVANDQLRLEREQWLRRLRN